MRIQSFQKLEKALNDIFLISFFLYMFCNFRLHTMNENLENFIPGFPMHSSIFGLTTINKDYGLI
jgi:hypothetical protein